MNELWAEIWLLKFPKRGVSCWREVLIDFNFGFFMLLLRFCFFKLNEIVSLLRSNCNNLLLLNMRGTLINRIVFFKFNNKMIFLFDANWYCSYANKHKKSRPFVHKLSIKSLRQNNKNAVRPFPHYRSHLTVYFLLLVVLKYCLMLSVIRGQNSGRKNWNPPSTRQAGRRSSAIGQRTMWSSLGSRLGHRYSRCF